MQGAHAQHLGAYWCRNTILYHVGAYSIHAALAVRSTYSDGHYIS